MIHIPILRKGIPYVSLDVARLPHHQTRETYVETSQANVGLIRRDLRDQASNHQILAQLGCRDLIHLCRMTAESFAKDTLPVGEIEQTPEDYVLHVSATTGLPQVMAR